MTNQRGAIRLALQRRNPGLLRQLVEERRPSGAPPEEASLSAHAAQELWLLLGAPRGAREADRCRELCGPLDFFKPLAPEQSEVVFQHGELVEVPAAEYVERAGDPVGFVYVILRGSVARQRRCEDVGSRSLFFTSLYDGHAFGDFWDEDDAELADKGRHPKSDKEVNRAAGRRVASAVAQEHTFLLRLSSHDYQVAIMGGDGVADPGQRMDGNTEFLKALPFLQPCMNLELNMLARLMEPRKFSFGERVILPGQRPEGCFVLTSGRCVVRSGRADISAPLCKLRAGDYFGQGALMDPLLPCRYASQVTIEVDSTVAHFGVLLPKPTTALPESVCKEIHELLRDAEATDVILNDGSGAFRAETRWRRQKGRAMAEAFRCSRTAAAEGLRAEEREHNALARWRRFGPPRAPSAPPRAGLPGVGPPPAGRAARPASGSGCGFGSAAPGARVLRRGERPAPVAASRLARCSSWT